jgi:hypothetical protein
MLFFFFYKISEQEGRTCPGWGVGTSGKGRDMRKGCKRVNMVKYYIHMCVNGKMRPVETISGMEGVKENNGGNEFKYDIFDI